jgi:hypothetical protein
MSTLEFIELAILGHIACKEAKTKEVQDLGWWIRLAGVVSATGSAALWWLAPTMVQPVSPERPSVSSTNVPMMTIPTPFGKASIPASSIENIARQIHLDK